MTVLPLIGTKSLTALRALHTLLLGLKMLPSYVMESYEKFHAAFETKTDAEKEVMIREAILFVKLEDEEIEALLSFTTDKNGVPYSKVNIKNLSPKDLHECIVAVCMELSRIKIDLVTEAEKKN